jgi:hypothetical protein
MSAMAHAVENSEFVLICMSNSYKQSTYCQAEAEYAFGCKRRLLPLIVRPNYRADGWLGFLIGSRIYIDFGRFDFPTACNKLMNEIRLQQDKLPIKTVALPSHDVPEVTSIGTLSPIVPTRKTSSETPISMLEDTLEPKRILPTPTNMFVRVPQKQLLSELPDKYMKRQATANFQHRSLHTWTESDVLDFLFMHRLNELMVPCETMNGCALMQLYKMCTTHINQAYTLLNDQLQQTYDMTLSIGIYTRFLSIMEEKLAKPVINEAQVPEIVSTMKSNYDLLITSNASTTSLLQFVDHVLPQLSTDDLSRPTHLFYG